MFQDGRRGAQVEYLLHQPLGEMTEGPERVDDPDVLVEYLSGFHGCKGSESFRESCQLMQKRYAHSEVTGNE